MMEKREIKNCVGEIIDELCNRNGFDDWWYNLDDEVEKEITDKLEEIVEKRFNKMKDKNINLDIIIGKDDEQ